MIKSLQALRTARLQLRKMIYNLNHGPTDYKVNPNDIINDPYNYRDLNGLAELTGLDNRLYRFDKDMMKHTDDIDSTSKKIIKKTELTKIDARILSRIEECITNYYHRITAESLKRKFNNGPFHDLNESIHHCLRMLVIVSIDTKPGKQKKAEQDKAKTVADFIAATRYDTIPHYLRETAKALGEIVLAAGGVELIYERDQLLAAIRPFINVNDYLAYAAFVVVGILAIGVAASYAAKSFSFFRETARYYANTKELAQLTVDHEDLLPQPRAYNIHIYREGLPKPK